MALWALTRAMAGTDVGTALIVPMAAITGEAGTAVTGMVAVTRPPRPPLRRWPRRFAKIVVLQGDIGARKPVNGPLPARLVVQTDVIDVVSRRSAIATCPCFGSLPAFLLAKRPEEILEHNAVIAHDYGMPISEHVIRATYSDRTIRVYQAYRPEIALPALEVGRFVPPFSMTRMTWIKPSFNWMMYRSGYATKPGQEVVLAIDIRREGFEWALEHAVLSSFSPVVYSSPERWRTLLAVKPVRIQWDPERDWRLQPITGVRTLQIGLSGEAIKLYVNHWIVRIEDAAPAARMVAAAVESNTPPPTLPSDSERPYPLDAARAAAIGSH